MKGKAKTSAILIMAIVFLASVIFFPQSALSDPKDPREPLTEINCSSCDDCSEKLNGDYDIVTLENDINNHAGTCIIFGADDVIFDGGGHLIDGTGTGYGVNLNGHSGLTVENCEIKEFEFGIYGENSNNINIINNNINNNGHGIFWSNGDSFSVIDNVIEDNTFDGIAAGNTNTNIIQSNDIISNLIGINLGSTENSIISNNHFFINGLWGLSLSSTSFDNLIYHNNFVFNYDGINQTSDDGINTWYNDYPGGGNYWNNYDSPGEGCFDTLGGENQDMPWSDWICDINYTNGNIVDVYPWTEPDLIDNMPTLYAPNHVYAGVGNAAMIAMSGRDPNNEPLTYHVNNTDDTNFVEIEEGIFIWETAEGDEGEYQVIAWVSDGEYNATKMVNVTVMDGFSVHHVMPYFSIETYSSAATANMIINYLGNDSVNQQEIYDYGIQYNLPENPTGELDPRGMDHVLGHFDPYDVSRHEYDEYDNRSDGNPYEGYNFGVRSVPSDRITDYMRDIAHWMDYQVHLFAGSPDYADPDRVPPAVPIYGDTNGYSNWVVVNGFASDVDPLPPDSPYNPDFTVHGFWLTDPNTDGLGINRYTTAEEAESTYFKPISSTDQYNGKFVQVAEPPPEESDAQVTIARLETKQENTKLVNSLKTSDKPEKKPTAKTLNEQKEPEIVWEEIIPEFLFDDPLFAEAFKGSEQGKQILVNNPSDGRDYYIITFEKNHLTSAAIIVDAESGIFREGSWTEKPENYVLISEEKAIDKVLRYLKSEKIRISKSDKNKILSELIWNPGEITSSPFQPYWKVIVKDMVFYVKNDGTVIHIPSLTL